MTWVILKMNKPEWLWIAVGCLVCILYGAAQPTFGIVLGKLFSVRFRINFIEQVSNVNIHDLLSSQMFQKCDKSEQEKEVRMYALIFFGFGIFAFIASFLQVILIRSRSLNELLITIIIIFNSTICLLVRVKHLLNDYAQKRSRRCFDKMWHILMILRIRLDHCARVFQQKLQQYEAQVVFESVLFSAIYSLWAPVLSLRLFSHGNLRWLFWHSYHSSLLVSFYRITSCRELLKTIAKHKMKPAKFVSHTYSILIENTYSSDSR